MMTVSQLIAVLQRHNPDQEVMVQCQGEFWPIHDITSGLDIGQDGTGLVTLLDVEDCGLDIIDDAAALADRLAKK